MKNDILNPSYTVYHKSPSEQGIGNAITCEWGEDGNGEWRENYWFSTQRDLEDIKNQVFAKFPNYAVDTPTWEELLSKVVNVYTIEGNITFFIKGDTVILHNWCVGQNYNTFDVIGQPYMNENLMKKEIEIPEGEYIQVNMQNQNLSTLVRFSNEGGKISWKQESVTTNGKITFFD